MKIFQIPIIIFIIISISVIKANQIQIFIPPQDLQHVSNFTNVARDNNIIKVNGYIAYDYPNGRYRSYGKLINSNFEASVWYFWDGSITKKYTFIISSIQSCECSLLYKQIPDKYIDYVDPSATFLSSYCETADNQIGNSLWVIKLQNTVFSWCLKDNQLLERTSTGIPAYIIMNNYKAIAPPDYYFDLPDMCKTAQC